jgi:hypothetical protein
MKLIIIGGKKRPAPWTGAIELTIRTYYGDFIYLEFKSQKEAAEATGVHSNQLSDIWRRHKPVMSKLGLIIGNARVVR